MHYRPRNASKPQVTPLPSSLSADWRDWLARARAALLVLDALAELDTVIKEDEALHLCDVKPEHFGVSAHGRVKVVDADSVGLRSIVGESSLFR